MSNDQDPKSDRSAPKSERSGPIPLADRRRYVSETGDAKKKTQVTYTDWASI